METDGAPIDGAGRGPARYARPVAHDARAAGLVVAAIWRRAAGHRVIGRVGLAVILIGVALAGIYVDLLAAGETEQI